MPYYWPKPIYKALNQYIYTVLKDREVDIDMYSVKIMRDFLIGKGMLVSPDRCLHESVNIGSRKTSPICCWDCGLSFWSEEDLERVRAQQKKKLEKALDVAQVNASNALSELTAWAPSQQSEEASDR